MRLLLTGGGTAGHINPALAIAQTVKQNDPTAEIAFVGVRGKREEDLVPRAGYPLYFVQARGFVGKLPYIGASEKYAESTISASTVLLENNCSAE